MKVSKPRPETVKKYTLYLQSLIVKINRYHHTFNASDFTREGRLSKNFVKHCLELGFIVNTGSRKSPNYKSSIEANNVTEFHGRCIAEKSLRYLLNHPSQDYKENAAERCVIGGEKTEEVIASNAISTFSTEDLIAELKRRGYTGKLERTEEVKF